ncbi:hypothetical protein Hypma_003680 [Hypsizygus marmoreus]|uniref:Uncharacterized protein n=1 Tax=Hypsizygus marmoreus TaxID=39966 RepID=A0A369J3V9_HYPMA|nr:hypothetical protein Hypma_003680 [Hypsizygus marmoreus]
MAPRHVSAFVKTKRNGNSGLFVDGIYTTKAHDSFLKYAGPRYMKASREKKIEEFFELFFPVWFDRFPITLDDGLDDDEPGGVDKYRLEWAEGLQKKYLRQKMIWVGSIQCEGWYKCRDWQEELNIADDRKRRRQEYFNAAARGNFLKGHQYDVAVTREEKAKAAWTLDDYVDDLLENIRNDTIPNTSDMVIAY